MNATTIGMIFVMVVQAGFIVWIGAQWKASLKRELKLLDDNMEILTESIARGKRENILLAMVTDGFKVSDTKGLMRNRMYEHRVELGLEDYFNGTEKTTN